MSNKFKRPKKAIAIKAGAKDPASVSAKGNKDELLRLARRYGISVKSAADLVKKLEDSDVDDYVSYEDYQRLIDLL